MSNKTHLLTLDNSIKKPSSTNMMQPFTGGPDLIRRCSTIGSSIPSTFAFVAQKHHLSLNLKKEAEEFKIKEELDNWEKTQPEENQINVKIAKQRILECYKLETDLLNLSGLGLTSVPTSALQKLNNLAWLYLNGNQLSSFDGTGLINLTRLNLNNNQLSSFDGTGLINLKYLYLINNRKLHQLPMSLGQCRNLFNIDNSGTAVPNSLIDAILSSCKALRDSSSASDLPIKLNLWKGFAGVDTDFDFINSFLKGEIATLNEWLQRLERSNDFRKNQQNLALVVCNILKDLQNKEFKELALVQMEANNEACQDRAAMALNELFLSWSLFCPSQVLSNTQKSDLIIKAGKTVALHNAIANQLTGRTDLKESVETYLFYEIKLAKELNLLTCIQNMSYPRCSKLLDEEALKNYVEENFLKEAASIPILDNLLKEASASTDPVAAKTQNDIERTSYYARKQLELLAEKEPQKQENETEEELKHRSLEWESNMNKIARENKERILAIKMDYLKICKS